VVPTKLAADVPSAVATLMSRPEQSAHWLRGRPAVLWAGTDAPAGHRPRGGHPGRTGPDRQPAGRVWIDVKDFLHQELMPTAATTRPGAAAPTPTRAGTGINGDRIDYLDDLGFWAYGEFQGDELHHAGTS